jgi:cobyrinic acid a,c-diamide synthase
MLPADRVLALFDRASRDADISVIEGVMGLFDGAGYEGEDGSSAHVAKLLQVPVLLVIDGSKMARSAAALARGFQCFDPEVRLAGIIVNRVGSDRHGAGLATAIQAATSLPVLGWIPRGSGLQVPERHLGLVPAAEPGPWHAFVEAAAAAVARHLDVERLVELAQQAPTLPAGSCQLPASANKRSPTNGHRPVLAIARDEAFHFTYRENLELLEAAGAEIVFFSPVQDVALPPRVAGVILSGGFPEVHAARLSANTQMHRALRDAHVCGLPMYAECGGLMYLTEAIVDYEGHAHSMVGILPGRCRMTGKLTLGYREARAETASWLFDKGDAVRGHEFHYSEWEGRPKELSPAYVVRSTRSDDPPRAEGAALGSLWVSYVHLHFGARPELAARFVAAATAGACTGR